MSSPWRTRFRFRLRDLFVVILGIAIGYSLNPVTKYLSPRAAAPTLFPAYIIEPPDILTIRASGKFSDALPSISGDHLVGPDGNINLGAFGNVYVASCTIAQAESAIQTVLRRKTTVDSVWLDVAAYNSKSFYIITQNGGADTITASPIYGNETVLDAVARIGGVPMNSRLWIGRPAPNGGKEETLQVAWQKIAAGTSMSTNHQLWPRDRLYIDTRSIRPNAN
jgi:protein involved in polysaccharide export with SLBB domain